MNLVFVLLSIVHTVACLFLVFVVLLQKGEGGGLGGAFGGGAVETAFGAKADYTMKRWTAIFAAVFMIGAMLLGVIQNHSSQRSLAGDAARQQSEGQSGGATPGENTQRSESLGESQQPDGSLGGEEQPAPTTPEQGQ